MYPYSEEEKRQIERDFGKYIAKMFLIKIAIYGGLYYLGRKWAKAINEAQNDDQ